MPLVTLRVSLNLVILRIGLVYGPYIDFGLSEYITTLIILISHISCSDKRADGGSRVWLHEKAHEIIVRFRHI